MKNNSIIFILFLLSINGWSQTSSNPFQIGISPSKKAKTVAPVSIVKDTTSTDSGNPFQIDGKQKQSILAPAIVQQNLISSDSTKQESASSNPFSIDGQPKTAIDTHQTANPFSIEPVKTITSEPTEREPIALNKTTITQKKSNLLFYLITGSLFLFTLLLTAYRSYFNKVYQTFLSTNLLKTIYRKVSNSNNYTVFLLLYTIFFYNIALFIFLVYLSFRIPIAPTGYTFFIILLGVISFFTLRHIVLNLLGNIFPVKENIGLYSFLIINFNIGIGVVLLPLNIFIANVSPEIGRLIIYATFGILVLFIMYKSFRGLDIAKKVISYYKLHFFLYLCAIEIAPILILIKYLSKLGY